MTRVQVADDYMRDGLAIRVTNAAGDPPGCPSLLLGIKDGRSQWEPSPAEAAIMNGTESGVTMTLPEDVARALLDALTRHYHGTEDTRALRKDYDAERARVDKLTDAVIGLADALAGE